MCQQFLKFGDDDDENALNAKDALLMWVKNKVCDRFDDNNLICS